MIDGDFFFLNGNEGKTRVSQDKHGTELSETAKGEGEKLVLKAYSM